MCCGSCRSHVWAVFCAQECLHQMIFDPTMSKKKKKKKKPFMLDEEGGGGDPQTEETQQSETKEVEPEPTEDKDVEADEEDSRKKDTTDDLDDLNFFNQKKKKKKTKKIFDIDEAEEGVKELKIEGDVPETVEPEDDLDIMLGNKKKKKKNVKFPDEDEIMEKDEAFEDEDSKKDDGISFSLQSGPAWAGSERDYTYDELLNRVFNIMREKNPDMVAGEKRKFVMKPPQVVRVGTKKTSFVNFTDICKLLHRQPKHLLAFLLAELGTSGSIDGNNQLVIKGRFQQKQIENVLRRYITKSLLLGVKPRRSASCFFVLVTCWWDTLKYLKSKDTLFLNACFSLDQIPLTYFKKYTGALSWCFISVL
uniref:Eukaryotic translation initiation factor 2 subunit 2 n=1 Tax=Ficedula albicollis TaxID=59894 RepID=U3K7R6_FICAL